MTRTRTIAIGGGVLLLAAAVAVVFAATRGTEEPARTAAPSETPSAVPSPTPSAAPKVVKQLRPFRIRLDGIATRPVANAPLFGRRQLGHGGRARPVARRAVVRLQRYLNEQFVSRRTRFTAKPVKTLLTLDAQRLLTTRSRVALGVGMDDVIGGTTHRARARALVLHRGRTIENVTIRYAATMTLTRKGGREQRWRQGGSVVMVYRQGAWRAALVDVRLVRG